MSSPRKLVDSHPTLLAGATEKARPVVSITYKSTSSGRLFAEIARGRSAGSATPEKTFIRRSDTLTPPDRLDAIVTRLPFRSSVRVNTSATSVVCPAPQRVRSLWACSGNCVSGRTMIATCANPACNVPFRYFRSGKIFMLEANDVDPRSRTDPPKHAESSTFGCVGNAPRPCT